MLPRSGGAGFEAAAMRESEETSQDRCTADPSAGEALAVG